ncbi:MAG TPA: nickel-dependent lactate racemase [Armatimonadota bacterium]|nr:nickel-dependent lactate racemase [Armatimonadota bacterium]
MDIQLAYGRHGLPISIPDEANVTVLEPEYVAGVSDPLSVLCDALRHPIDSPPLRELVQPSDTVGIVFSDVTRPTPSHLLIPAVCAELSHVPDEQIILFNATGTHRFNTDAELRAMLGDTVVDRFRIVQNDANAANEHVYCGTTHGGNAVWLHSEFMACTKRILTGFIEPHFFAGFSGSGKALMPGLARLDTVQRNHCAMHMDHPQARWGITHGNPLWEDIYEAGLMANPTFLLNVTLNRDKAITQVFAGEYTSAHQHGCAYVRKTAMAAVDSLFDIVITTNSGYPLDRNLYQAVKGISAAAQVVKEGGSIIVAAECCDGLPDASDYAHLLQEASSYDELLTLLRTPGNNRADTWTAHIQALIGQKADLYLYSSHLTDAQIRQSLLTPCRSIEQKISELLAKYGPDARICILPEGPQTIPYLESAPLVESLSTAN